MKRLFNFILAIGLMVGAVFAFNKTVSAEEAPLKTVTSFSIITDMVEQIGGDHVEVHNVVPLGTDPHEYEPLPQDLAAATDADLLFYYGLNLEGSEDGWFMKLANSANQEESALVEVAKEVDPMYLKDEAGSEEINPHAFLSPKVGIQTAQAIVEGLKAADPDNAEDYDENGEKYIAQLTEVDNQYAEKFGKLADDQKNFMASEYAFQYVTDEYGLNHGYIWAVDTDENGSPDQIKSAVEWVKEHEPAVLFVESNVDRRPMETVSNETGVIIFEKEVYGDEIGDKDSDADTYIKMLEKNLEVIFEGLNK